MGYHVMAYEQALSRLQIQMTCSCGDAWCCLALMLVSAKMGNLATGCALIWQLHSAAHVVTLYQCSEPCGAAQFR